MRFRRAVEDLGHAGVAAGRAGQRGVETLQRKAFADPFELPRRDVRLGRDPDVRAAAVGMVRVGQKEDGGQPLPGNADGALPGHPFEVLALVGGENDLVLRSAIRHPCLQLGNSRGHSLHRTRQRLLDEPLGLLLLGLGQPAEAWEQYDKALAIQEKLSADFPAVPEYHIALGWSYCNYGNIVREGGAGKAKPRLVRQGHRHTRSGPSPRVWRCDREGVPLKQLL